MTARSPCSVPLCANPLLAKGLCNRHYKRRALYGDPEAPPAPKGPRPRPLVHCLAEGCPRSSEKRGLCNMHYKRVRRTGRTEHLSREASFWTQVQKRPDGCWVWTGACSSNGYGAFWADGRQISAHRFSYQSFFGAIPRDKPVIMHMCDNPPCVRPEHLRAGTAVENTADMMAKGRAKFPRAGHRRTAASRPSLE